MESRGSKQWWSSTVITRAGLSQSSDGWSRLTKQMFGSGGLCRSLSRIWLDKRRIRWRNASHPCNSLLRLSLTSLAIKTIFIEGMGQTLMLSRDCSTPVEVINIKTNMAVLSDESQNGLGILVFIPSHCTHKYTIPRVTFLVQRARNFTLYYSESLGGHLLCQFYITWTMSTIPVLWAAATFLQQG